MAEFIQNIISISNDGKFNLLKDNLNDIMSKANNCNNLAIITVIGSKGSGKSFLGNCFHKYLETLGISEWSNSLIEYGECFYTDKSTIEVKPYIQLSSPLFLENECQKTGIFLMDATNVFENMKELMDNKIMMKVIQLYLFISSTVIFIMDGIEELEVIQKFFNDLGEIIKGLPFSLENSELVFIFRDWNQMRKFDSKENYLFGAINGKRFLDNEFETGTISNSLAKIQCFLMPRANVNPEHLNIDLSTLGDLYIKQFTNLMQNIIFNQDELKIKIINGNIINGSQIANFIENFIMHINEIDQFTFPQFFSTFTINSRETTIPLPSPPFYLQDTNMPPPPPSFDLQESNMPLPPPPLDLQEIDFPPPPQPPSFNLQDTNMPPPPPPFDLQESNIPLPPPPLELQESNIPLPPPLPPLDLQDTKTPKPPIIKIKPIIHANVTVQDALYNSSLLQDVIERRRQSTDEESSNEEDDNWTQE